MILTAKNIGHYGGDRLALWVLAAKFQPYSLGYQYTATAAILAQDHSGRHHRRHIRAAPQTLHWEETAEFLISSWISESGETMVEL